MAREHSWDTNRRQCQQCGAAQTTSGACRGYRALCPCCVSPLEWGTASLYAYGQHNPHCVMPGVYVWISQDGNRWTGALEERDGV